MLEKAIEEIDGAINDLKVEAVPAVDEVRQMLQSLRPQEGKRLWVYVRERPGYDTISIVWTQVLYFNKAKNFPHYRDIARGRGYQISQKRFLHYARGYLPPIQEELMEYEKLFGSIRRRQGLLSQARSALIQIQKESDKGGRR